MNPKIISVILLFLVVGNASRVQAQKPDSVYLWPNGAPGALGQEHVDRPTLSVYLPPKEIATGTAVVVCPGGGYGHLAMDHEGRQIAQWLNARGVAAFVLKYRLGPRYRHPIQLGDAQRAVRLVRSQSATYGVRPDRIGIWGFSAGGHLASTASTHFDDGNATASEMVDRASSRPDFSILAYPVISFDPAIYHGGSRRNLIGDNPDQSLVDLLSNEQQVTPRTPPTFLFHTTDDPVVPVENSLRYFEALRKAGVPAELHVYEHGLHGVGLVPADPILATWGERLTDWLRYRGLLSR